MLYELFSKIGHVGRVSFTIPHRTNVADFEKCSHLREIEGVLIFLPGMYGGLYTNLKNRMVISRFGTPKTSHLKISISLQVQSLSEEQNILLWKIADFHSIPIWDF